jgi:single-strand DNA-binding protein
MSYISRTGYLAETPVLREGEHGPYTHARVIVSDRIRGDDGTYTDGPAVAYDVAVSGSQAVNLVQVAKASGNIRVIFAGRYRVTRYTVDRTTRILHEVRADDIGVALRAQRVTVERASHLEDPGETIPF